MKIRLFSDVHLEFSGHKWEHLWKPSPEDQEQIVVLAGDIDTGVSAMPFVDALCDSFKYVVLVAGNHEFYNNDHAKVIAGWQEHELNGPKNFHFLNNDTRHIDGYRFVGGTMWTSFENKSYRIMEQARMTMNDYRCIYNGNDPITPNFVYDEHIKFMDHFTKEMAIPFDGKTVVVTHHSPGDGLRIRGVPDPLYFAGIEPQIAAQENLVLWMHGHSHHSYDYMIANTRVVGNPYGYYNYAVNEDFVPNLILEV